MTFQTVPGGMLKLLKYICEMSGKAQNPEGTISGLCSAGNAYFTDGQIADKTQFNFFRIEKKNN